MAIVPQRSNFWSHRNFSFRQPLLNADDIQLEVDGNDPNMSASDKRKANSQRRSNLAEAIPPPTTGDDSEDEQIDVKKMKADFEETR